MDIRGQWKELAEQMGFTFQEGLTPFLQTPPLQRIMAQDMKMADVGKLEQFLANPLVRTMIEKMVIGVATGHCEGFDFALFRSSTTSQLSNSHKPIYYSNVVLFFDQPRDIGIDIAKAGLLTKLGKKLAPSRYIQIPRAEIEAMVRVRARDTQQASALVSTERVQDSLTQLYKHSRSYTVNDHGVRYQEVAHIISHEQALAAMTVMTAFAREWEQAP